MSGLPLKPPSWSALLAAVPTELFWGCHDTIQEAVPLTDQVPTDLPLARAGHTSHGGSREGVSQENGRFMGCDPNLLGIIDAM